MKNSKSATKRMKRRVKRGQNACKANINNCADKGCVINTIDKKLAALNS